MSGRTQGTGADIKPSGSFEDPHLQGKDIIVLSRHGKPALSRRVLLTSAQFRQWWQQYDAGGLARDQKAKPKTAHWAKRADIVISSTLRRAVETAHLASGDMPDKQMEELVEAALPSPPLGPVKLTPRIWGTLARIVWWCGYSSNMESVGQARERAKLAAQLLSEQAEGGKLVFVAAHGWFNRMIGSQLKREGWLCTQDQGDLHWCYRFYERPSRPQSD